MEIWSRNKDCRRLPDFLVIGPQKTGTTALYRFLQLHPAIESNFNSDKTFEELQFFSNSDFYAQGNLSKSIDNWSGVTQSVLQVIKVELVYDVYIKTFNEN